MWILIEIDVAAAANGHLTLGISMAKAARKPKQANPDAKPVDGAGLIELLPIANEAELDGMLEQLGKLDAKAADLDAKCQGEIDPIVKKYQALRVIQIDGKDVALVDRRELLAKSIEAFCEANKKALLNGERKSLELTHGTISWRAVPKYVAILGDKKEDDWIAAAAKKLQTAVISLAARLTLVKGIAFEKVLKISYKWDKREIVSLFSQGRLSKKQLERCGLAVISDEEKFSVEPSAVQVENHSASAPG